MQSGDEILYYDFNELSYSSFFLTGFLENAEASGYRFKVSRAIPGILTETCGNGGWSGILFSICLFRARLRGKTFHFCIDTRDSRESARDRGAGYHLPLLERVACYFKVNYNEEIIREDPNLRPFADRIIPAAPFFPVRPPRLLSFLPRLRSSAAVGWDRQSVVRRAKDLIRIPRLNDVVRLRDRPKDLDIFFVMRYYPEAVHTAHNEFRHRVMREIRKHAGLRSIAGFAAERELPEPYSEFRVSPYRFKDYLERMSAARVGIYVRGLFDCVSFKLPQFLALGMPVIGQTILNNRSVLYGNEFFGEQFAFEDPAEIVGEAVKLLGDPERLVRLGERNAKTFDSEFTPRAAVSRILTRLGE